MTEPNFTTRTLYHSDNLPVLRGMNSGTVDLIATDPPFNKSKDFHATPDSLAAGAKFVDRWRWENDVHQEWVDAIKDDHPGLWQAIENGRGNHSPGMGAFLCWLGVRLVECHRILKPTGSLYLHIDHTAHAYAKPMLDAIFGAKNFRNEIVWAYTGPGSPRIKQFNRKHDTLLWYNKGDKWVFNRDAVRLPYKDGKPHTGGFTHRSGAKAGANMDRAVADSYQKGKVSEDWWSDIAIAKRSPKENTGYPTQKPLALYERIIKASSNEGDLVLDPFCGCATTPVAAERLARRWVGIDIWDDAYDVVVRRMEDNRQLLRDPEAQIRLATAPPIRTDSGTATVPALTLRAQTVPQPWQSLSHAQMRTALCYAQRAPGRLVICAGCGRHLEAEFMHLDHIRPKSEQGANTIDNRALLCGPCNGTKGNSLTINGLWRANNRGQQSSRWMKSPDDAKLALANAVKIAKVIMNDYDGQEAQEIIAGARLE